MVEQKKHECEGCGATFLCSDDMAGQLDGLCVDCAMLARRPQTEAVVLARLIIAELSYYSTITRERAQDMVQKVLLDLEHRLKEQEQQKGEETNGIFCEEETGQSPAGGEAGVCVPEVQRQVPDETEAGVGAGGAVPHVLGD